MWHCEHKLGLYREVRGGEGRWTGKVNLAIEKKEIISAAYVAEVITEVPAKSPK